VYLIEMSRSKTIKLHSAYTIPASFALARCKIVKALAAKMFNSALVHYCFEVVVGHLPFGLGLSIVSNQLSFGRSCPAGMATCRGGRGFGWFG
jgi:hypothetical protein